MPHDKHGKVLAKGDKVNVEFTVREVYPGANFCGVSLERQVDGEQNLLLLCQASQTAKVDA